MLVPCVAEHLCVEWSKAFLSSSVWNISIHSTIIRFFMYTTNVLYVINCFYLFYAIFTDINECTEGTHLCNHTCSNLVGSYRCSCMQGFILAENNQDCISK